MPNPSPHAAQEPEQFLGPCPTCGGYGRRINPAWLLWKRKRAGVLQKDLARLAGVSGAFVCDVEHGNRNCPAELEKVYAELVPR